MGKNKKKIKWKHLHFEDIETSDKEVRKKVAKPFEKTRSVERNTLTKSPISSEPKLNLDSGVLSTSADNELREEDYYVANNEVQWNRELNNQPSLPSPVTHSLFFPYPFDSTSFSLIPFPYNLLQSPGSTYGPYPNLAPTQPIQCYKTDSRKESETQNETERELVETDYDRREKENFLSYVPNYTTPQFVLEPWIYAAPSQFNGYPWLSSVRQRTRRSQPARYGGEGISYDRWPSRIKCPQRRTSTTNNMNDVKQNLMAEEEEEAKKNTTMTKKTKKTDEGIINAAYETEVTTSKADPIQYELEKDEVTTTNFDDDLNRFVIVESLIDELVDRVVDLAESSENIIGKEPENSVQKASSDDESEHADTEDEMIEDEDQLPTESYMSPEPKQTTVELIGGISENDEQMSKYADYYHLCSEMVDDGSLSPVTLCSLEGDVIVHEVDDEDVSDCGSEDVEMFGHRYETTAEKLYKTNQVSLAIELLSAKENVPYDSFVRYESLDDRSTKSCYTNTHVLEGFYGEMHRDKNKKKKKRGEFHLDSGIHTSDEEAEEDKLNGIITSEDEEILFERDESGNDSFEYRRFGNGRTRRRAPKTPLMYLGNSDSWYGCCCIVM